MSIYYDPMLAKLTAWAPTRELSLHRMEVALSQFQVLGVITNIPLLRAVVKHPRFQAGEYDTGFLEWNPAVTKPIVSDETRTMARALAAWASGQPSGANAPARATAYDGRASATPWQSAGGVRFP